MLTEEDLKEYEKEWGIEAYMPTNEPRFDSKYQTMQRLIATVRLLMKENKDLKEYLNRYLSA